MKHLFRITALLAATSLLGACATAPKPLQGAFTPVTPRDTVTNAQAPGTSVRWGGRIVDTTPRANDTCFQLISRPLNATGRPLRSAPDATDGRFIACRAGFYDPAVFTEGREVTFIGHVDGVQSTKIGEYEYRLPKITADVVYLWPEEREVRVHPYPYMYDPFWGPGWGRRGWGWGFNGWW